MRAAFAPEPGSPPLSLPEAYAGFCAPEADPASAHAVYTVLAPDHPRLTPARPGTYHWTSDIWRLGGTGDSRLALEIQDVVHDRWIPVMNLNEDFRAGEIQPFAGRQGDPSNQILNYPADQVLLTNLLADCGVVVLHAAAVVMDGRGLVLGGRSGIGKTTLSRLCRDAGGTLLNDDRCALYLKDGVPWVGPTPWHGEEPEIRHVQAPLAAVVHLDQAPVNQLRPQDEAEALASLLATGIAPFYRKASLETVLEAMDKVLAAVPSFRFAFAPTPAAVIALRGIGIQ